MGGSLTGGTPGLAARPRAGGLEEIRGQGVKAEARKMGLDEGFPDDARAVDELMDALFFF